MSVLNTCGLMYEWLYGYMDARMLDTRPHATIRVSLFSFVCISAGKTAPVDAKTESKDEEVILCFRTRNLVC